VSLNTSGLLSSIVVKNTLAGPSNSQVWNTFVPGALTSILTDGRFTPDGNLTLTRIQVQLSTTPSGCKTAAVIQVTDGTVGGTRTLPLQAAVSESGPVSINYAADVPLAVSVSVAAAGCKPVRKTRMCSSSTRGDNTR
jgi:hypothetical protein